LVLSVNSLQNHALLVYMIENGADVNECKTDLSKYNERYQKNLNSNEPFMYIDYVLQICFDYFDRILNVDTINTCVLDLANIRGLSEYVYLFAMYGAYIDKDTYDGIRDNSVKQRIKELIDTRKLTFLSLLRDNAPSDKLKEYKIVGHIHDLLGGRKDEEKKDDE